MADDLQYVALIESAKLRAAVRTRLGRRVRLASKRPWRNHASGHDHRVVYFLEPRSGNGVAPDHAQLVYVLYVSKSAGTLPLPEGSTAVLHGCTAKQVADQIAEVISTLETAPQQCIVAIRHVDDQRVDVEFLDGKTFSVRVSRRTKWVTVSGDRSYVVAIAADGSRKTIPWDSIRRPAREIDELTKTRKRIANALRRWRDESGLSQQIVARRSGLSRVTISRLEHAGHLPALKTLRALARAYDTSLQELLESLRA